MRINSDESLSDASERRETPQRLIFAGGSVSQNIGIAGDGLNTSHNQIVFVLL